MHIFFLTRRIVCIVLLFISFYSFGQFIPKSTPTLPSHLQKTYWETALGLQIGGITHIEISPSIGYEPVKNLYTGMGFTYIFYRNNYYSPAWTTHIFGGSLYIRYLLFQKILLQGEYQWLNYDGLDDFSLEKIRKTVPGYLAGIGYRQWFSAQMYGDFFLLWNFNATADYPISNPSIRITIGGFFR